MATPKDIDYSKLTRELDIISEQLQSGELDIDEAIKKYERGMAIVTQLQTYLKKAQNKITRIKANFEDNS